MGEVSGAGNSKGSVIKACVNLFFILVKFLMANTTVKFIFIFMFRSAMYLEAQGSHCRQSEASARHVFL